MFLLCVYSSSTVQAHAYVSVTNTQGLTEAAVRSRLEKLLKFNGGSVRAITKYFVMAVISEIDRGELVSNMLTKKAQEIEMAYFFVTSKDHEAQSE